MKPGIGLWALAEFVEVVREISSYALPGRDRAGKYITAHIDSELAGFISITPPSAGRYSINKYIERNVLPLQFDETLYELRILTVARQHRSSRLAATLLYAAFRWIEERKGKQIVAMGRTETLSIYPKHGARMLTHQIKSGAVTYELLEADIEQLRGFAERHHRYYQRLGSEITWDITFPFFKAACCFHGGAFFDAIGIGLIFSSAKMRSSMPTFSTHGFRRLQERSTPCMNICRG